MPPEDEVIGLPDALGDVLAAQIAQVGQARQQAAAAAAAADAAQALLEGLFHGGLVALGVDPPTRARAMLLMSGRGYTLAPAPDAPPEAPEPPAAPNGTTTTPALVGAKRGEAET